jgi:hypothetical protein
MASIKNSKDFQDLSMLLGSRMNDTTAKQMRHYDQLAHDTDPQLMMLPHPARVTYMKQIEIAKFTYGEQWLEVSKIIADNSLSLYQTAKNLIETSPAFRLSYNITGNEPTGSNGGNAGIQLLGLRFALNKGHVFQTTDALDEQLHHTDIAETIPVSLIRPPYPVCYFEFGQSRKSPFTVSNEVSGDHVAEGCYVFEHIANTYMGQPFKEHRELIIATTGMPKAHLSDDAVRLYTIPILDEDLTIAETLSAFFELHKADIARARAMQIDMILQVADDSEMAELERVLRHLMKIMLYLSTAKALTTSNTERSEAEKKVRSAPAGLMRKKREEKADRVYDRIVIGPKQLPKPDLPTGGGGMVRHVSPHWRRGHFRDQRHGEGNKLIKTIFIEPQLIAAERIADSDVPAKTYIIKE